MQLGFPKAGPDLESAGGMAASRVRHAKTETAFVLIEDDCRQQISNPVHPRRLQGHHPNSALLQPRSHLLQLGRGASERAHRLAISGRRDGQVWDSLPISMPTASGCTTSKLRSSARIFRVSSRRCFRFISCQLRWTACLTPFLCCSRLVSIVSSSGQTQPGSARGVKPVRSLHRGRALSFFKL